MFVYVVYVVLVLYIVFGYMQLELSVVVLILVVVLFGLVIMFYLIVGFKDVCESGIKIREGSGWIVVVVIGDLFENYVYIVNVVDGEWIVVFKYDGKILVIFVVCVY